MNTSKRVPYPVLVDDLAYHHPEWSAAAVERCARYWCGVQAELGQVDERARRRFMHKLRLLANPNEAFGPVEDKEKLW